MQVELVYSIKVVSYMNSIKDHGIICLMDMSSHDNGQYLISY
ncbi:hypothetical protein [Clostridium perfringens]